MPCQGIAISSLSGPYFGLLRSICNKKYLDKIDINVNSVGYWTVHSIQ